MRFQPILAFLAFCLLSLPAHAIVQGTAIRDPNGLRRSVVAVENSEGELCSGALVAPDLVLTAAHCLTDKASYRVVSVNRAFRPQAVNVVAIASHPTFLPGTTPRTQPGVDLAVVKIARPLGADFRPFDLRQAGAIGEGETVTIAGFGVLSEDRKNTARTLRATRLLAVGTVQIANRVVIATDGKRLAETAGAGACRGDSGGPVLVRDSEGYRLYGIVSWSSGALNTRGQSACGGLTAVTDIAGHIGWIRGAMNTLRGLEGARTSQCSGACTADIPNAWTRR